MRVLIVIFASEMKCLACCSNTVMRPTLRHAAFATACQVCMLHLAVSEQPGVVQAADVQIELSCFALCFEISSRR